MTQHDDSSASKQASRRTFLKTSAIGEGVNAGNIRSVLEILRGEKFRGVLSMECEGQGGPMIERSLAWLRGTLKELSIPSGLT